MKNPIQVRRLSILCFSVLLGFAVSAHAAKPHGNTGAGVILGDPTGFTLKHWTTPTEAIDAALAYSFCSSVQIYGDYLWHDHSMFGHSSAFVTRLSGYVGVGLVMAFATDSGSSFNRKRDGGSTDFSAAIRVPFGMEYLIPTAPVTLGLELVPGMKFVPQTDLILQGGFIVRYYF